MTRLDAALQRLDGPPPCAPLADLFTHDGWQRSRWATTPVRADQLRQICGSCTIRRTCLTDALDDPDNPWFQGGTTPADRRHIRQQRKSVA